MAAPCTAEIYEITACEIVGGSKIEGHGTAVCIAVRDGKSLLLTAKHIVKDCTQNTWVAVRGTWYLAGNIHLHPRADLATMEVSGTLNPTPLGAGVEMGDTVTVAGYGPQLHGQTDGQTFTATIDTLDDVATCVAPDGQHAMPGDSGGAVFAVAKNKTRCCVGIVSYHDGSTAATSRRFYARQKVRARTGFVSAKTITKFVETQYGRCYGGACPIQIRPQVQQPFFGPFPVGPPRTIGIVEPVPQQYVPVPQPRYDVLPVPRPDPISIQGPRGPQGPQGPAGVSVTPAQVEAVVNAWLDSNRESLRGEQGPAGSDGNTAALESRLAELERRPFRIIISSDGKIVDDETYPPGEPVVLDLKRLRSVSGAK